MITILKKVISYRNRRYSNDIVPLLDNSNKNQALSFKTFPVDIISLIIKFTITTDPITRELLTKIASSDKDSRLSKKNIFMGIVTCLSSKDYSNARINIIKNCGIKFSGIYTAGLFSMDNYKPLLSIHNDQPFRSHNISRKIFKKYNIQTMNDKCTGSLSTDNKKNFTDTHKNTNFNINIYVKNIWEKLINVLSKNKNIQDTN